MQKLNIVPKKMTEENFKEAIFKYIKEGKMLFATSSFQTHSVVLLHLLSKIGANVPVYFVNTGYHFSETFAYKEHIAKLLGIKVIEIESAIPKIMQLDSSRRLMFASDPDYCCYLNKVMPVEKLLLKYDVWINGVRAAQTEHRSKFKQEEKVAHNTLRFHPLLEWTDEQIEAYIIDNSIPRHPLDGQGYSSIGCEPCTKITEGRNGRWLGLNKTECGINTEFSIIQN